jgi:hypothetical protein
MLTIGDHVRVKATGEIMMLDDYKSVEGVEFLILTKHGRMSGAPDLGAERIPVRRYEVTKVKFIGTWEDDE